MFRRNGEAQEKVEFTIGVTGVSSARKRSVKILNLNGISLTKENIVSGTYPLFLPLYLIIKGELEGATGEFIHWILTEEGQQVVSRQGTINLKAREQLEGRFRFWQQTDLIIDHE